MIKKLEDNFIYFMVFSVFGWIYEVLWNTFVLGRTFENRGFLFGPYLPIYGFGGLLLLYLLRKLIKKEIKIGKVNITFILVMVAIFFITTVVEYVGHYIMDTYFNIILWDYSKDYLNIDGRVCFAASRNFTILGLGLLYGVYPLLEKKIGKNNSKTKHVIVIILLIIFLLDFLFKII